MQGPNRQILDDWALPSVLNQLLQRNRPTGRATQVASDSDILRIRRPGEITAVTTTAFVAQCPDECVRGCDVDRQRRAGVAAGRFHAQFIIPC